MPLYFKIYFIKRIKKLHISDVIHSNNLFLYTVHIYYKVKLGIFLFLIEIYEVILSETSYLFCTKKGTCEFILLQIFSTLTKHCIKPKELFNHKTKRLKICYKLRFTFHDNPNPLIV